MGSDKALLDFRGRTVLDRATGVILEVCPAFAIVGDPAVFARHGEVIRDIYPGCGPLGGIHAALRHSQAELNVVLAVDMPFVSAQLIELLLTIAADSGAVVTVPRTSRGFQPLCAVYRPDFADVAEAALRAGKYKIDALFDSIRARVIEEEELMAAGFSERSFFNVNTPDDLRSAIQSFRP